MTQWFDNLPPRKRNIYAVLLGIILLTIPCYCLGIAALASAPPVTIPPTPTPFGFTATTAPEDELPSLLPNTATPTETSTQITSTPTATLEPTPTQLFPTVPPTNTPVPPTSTPSPTNTVLPTITPTGTTVPTITPTPTPTVNATATAAAIATATAAANKPPEANDDQASTTQGSSIVIGVLANDVDPNGNLDRTTVTIISAPANGNATVNGEGQVTFTPNANFVGTSAFTYQVCDTIGACDTATVTVTVTALNRPPVANNDNASTAEGEAVTINVVANDSDPDDNLDPATVSIVSDPANGTASVTGGGQVSYTPDEGFNGNDSFTYEVCDTEDACDTATVAITVTATNEPPVAGDDSANTSVDTPITINVLDNDSDPDDNLDPATVTIDSPPGNGAAEVGGNGQITYTPEEGYEGDDTFTYEVCDTADACDTATVSIAVNP